MKKILLTKGYVALVDDDDYARVCKFRWHVTVNRKTGKVYVRRHKRGQHGKAVWLHQFILDKDVKGIDHIDRDGLNNQKCNLRHATRSQNMMNRAGSRHKKFKGVSWMPRLHKWRAEITKDGKRFYLGVFSKEEIAAQVYNRAAREHHGEFAFQNKV